MKLLTNKHKLAKLVLILIVLNVLLFVGFVPVSMASSEFKSTKQFGELDDLGIVINGNRHLDQIYANGNMQAEVTMFWSFDDTLSEDEKKIRSVKLVDKITGEDIDFEGWNYKAGETYNSENEYLHQISLSGERRSNAVRESKSLRDSTIKENIYPRKYRRRFKYEKRYRQNGAKTEQVGIAPHQMKQGNADDYINLFVNYEEKNTAASVDFCAELTTASGYVESTCEAATTYGSATLTTIFPIVYTSDSWTLEIDQSSDQLHEWNSRFTFIDLFNKNSDYPGTQTLDKRRHVHELDGLDYHERDGLLYDTEIEVVGKSQTLVWPVEPDEERLQLVGYIEDGPQKIFVYPPDKSGGGVWAYRLVQIDHYTQPHDYDVDDPAHAVVYAYGNNTNDIAGFELPLLMVENPVSDAYYCWDNSLLLFIVRYGDMYCYDPVKQGTLKFIDRYGTTQSVTMRTSINQDFVEIVP